MCYPADKSTAYVDFFYPPNMPFVSLLTSHQWQSPTMKLFHIVLEALYIDENDRLSLFSGHNSRLDRGGVVTIGIHLLPSPSQTGRSPDPPSPGALVADFPSDGDGDEIVDVEVKAK